MTVTLTLWESESEISQSHVNQTLELIMKSEKKTNNVIPNAFSFDCDIIR